MHNVEKKLSLRESNSLDNFSFVSLYKVVTVFPVKKLTRACCPATSHFNSHVNIFLSSTLIASHSGQRRVSVWEALRLFFLMRQAGSGGF